jgi:hypothetical protein
MKFGTGSLQYELVENWEQLPRGWEHADVAGVCTDASGNVYLYCRGDHPVIIYDREGRFLDSWGEGRFSYRTHGMFMSGNDDLFLVDDSGHSVGRYGLDGTLLKVIGPSGSPSDSGYDGTNEVTVSRPGGPFNRPTNLAVAPSGDLYVSDGYGNCQMHRFDADGEYLQSWGTPGSGAGEFRLPHSTCVDASGRVFVADRQNDRIQIFGPAGEYLTEWTHIQRPTDIFIDNNGLVYVCELAWRVGETSFRCGPITEPGRSQMSIYDLEGNLLLRWGDLDGAKPGHFAAPHGIWVDDHGDLYVAEVTKTFGIRPGYVPEGTHTFQKFARV